MVEPVHLQPLGRILDHLIHTKITHICISIIRESQIDVGLCHRFLSFAVSGRGLKEGLGASGRQYKSHSRPLKVCTDVRYVHINIRVYCSGHCDKYVIKYIALKWKVSVGSGEHMIQICWAMADRDIQGTTIGPWIF